MNLPQVDFSQDLNISKTIKATRMHLTNFWNATARMVREILSEPFKHTLAVVIFYKDAGK